MNYMNQGSVGTSGPENGDTVPYKVKSHISGGDPLA